MVTERSSTSLMTNTTGEMNHHTKHKIWSLNFRVNYTGQWVEGEREGNGTTSFRDGAVYTGEYRWVTYIESSAHQLLCVRSGLEHGRGFIRYPNGNSLDAEFVAGKIMGHGVFKWVETLWSSRCYVDLDTPLGIRERDSSVIIFLMDRWWHNL